MPSPTSTTVPTLRVSTLASNLSMVDLMMLVISSDRMAIRSGCLQRAPATSLVRSRSRRPRTLASISRSPTRTIRPPSTLGSTRSSSAMRPPVVCSSRWVSARTSSGVERCGAGGDGVGDALAPVVEPAELRRDARQVAPAGPVGSRSWTRFWAGAEMRSPSSSVRTSARRSTGIAGLSSTVSGAFVARRRDAARSRSDRHVSSVSSRWPTSKAASA